MLKARSHAARARSSARGLISITLPGRIAARQQAIDRQRAPAADYKKRMSHTLLFIGEQDAASGTKWPFLHSSGKNLTQSAQSRGGGICVTTTGGSHAEIHVVAQLD